MLLSTPALAARVERAEIAFCAMAAGHDAPGNVLTLDRAGGQAVYGRLGSPLNKVLGLGVGTDVSDADIEAIEVFYATHGSSVTIELCPLAGGALAARLATRGYIFNGFENELGRDMKAPLQSPISPGVVVSTHASDRVWLETVARGFAAPESGADEEPAADRIATMSRMMRAFLHPAIVRYLAAIDGVPAGAGAAYVVDGVVGIFGTSTVPHYRRRGVQAAIVNRALADHASRADLAIATTEPGSTSQRTFERLGFQVLYTRSIMVRGAAFSAPRDPLLLRTARDAESRGA